MEDACQIYNKTRKHSDPKDLEFAAEKIKAIEATEKCAPLFEYILKKEEQNYGKE